MNQLLEVESTPEALHYQLSHFEGISMNCSRAIEQKKKDVVSMTVPAKGIDDPRVQWRAKEGGCTYCNLHKAIIGELCCAYTLVHSDCHAAHGLGSRTAHD